MRVGPREWLLVSTDTAGVPHGGLYGNVAWFEREANKRGMYLGWSRRFECFGIYTRPFRTRYISQMLCARKDNGRPVPLNRDLLAVLVHLRERMARSSAKTINDELRKLEAEQKYKEAVAREQLDQDMASDVIRATKLKRGKATPNTMVLPSRIARVGNG